MIPSPRFWIDGFTDSSEDLQVGVRWQKQHQILTNLSFAYQFLLQTFRYQLTSCLQKGDHVAPGLLLPPGDHDRQAPIPYHLMIPSPRFWIDGFTDSSEDLQT
jgi:hypothetical protein